MSQEQNKALRLGVNIDHVATIRQARGTRYPSPLAAAFVAQTAGADSITVHLREDRRHIQEQDVRELAQALAVPLNLEMAMDESILQLAEEIKPLACCIVPEKREELTTEGGLDVVSNRKRSAEICARLRAVGSRPSLFIEPEESQVAAAIEVGAAAVEFHTGHYANMEDPADLGRVVGEIARLSRMASDAGLQVHAGHGLHIENVTPIARIPEIEELNIGHSIVADALIMGMAAAVARMKSIMMHARSMPAARPAM